MLNKILSWVSLGIFERNIKESGYDKAMHLFMYVTLSNGKTIRIDKNHVVEMKLQSVPHHKDAEEMSVGGITSGLSLNQFLNKGIKSVGEKHYFEYDSRDFNCQDFVMLNLKANGLLTNELRNFISQDAEKILKGLGLLGKVNKGITDIAAKADTLIYGEGKN